jgi:hypothetical protein
MPATKRPSTSSLRRFISSRPYVTVSEVRRRFGLEESDAVSRLSCDGTTAWIGLPEREASKICELWQRGEIGLELSHEVHAPAVVGIYPMRLAWHVVNASNGQRPANGALRARGEHGAPDYELGWRPDAGADPDEGRLVARD